MELNAIQHRFLKQLAGRDGPASLKDLDLKKKPTGCDPLVGARFVETGRRSRSATFQLTDAGRTWLAANPEPPKRVVPLKPPKPPQHSFPFLSQRVFMLKLAFAPPGSANEGLSKALKAAERTTLVERNWVEVRSTRPRLHCELTDAGWQWVEDHLGDAIDGNQAEQVLGAVLSRVGAFLSTNDVRLADLLKAKLIAAQPSTEDEATDKRPVPISMARPMPESVIPPTAMAPTDLPPSGNLVAGIRDACRRLAHNAMSPHVKLADLRAALADWDQATVDDKLLKLELAGEVRLIGMDDPAEIEPRDEAAVLRTPAGHRRHLLYWTGS